MKRRYYDLLNKIAIAYLSFYLKRKMNNIEIIIRSDGNTIGKRNKEKELRVKDTLSKIKK